jgi:hypothetical protein
MDLKNLFVNMALFGLIVFGVMAFAIMTQEQNDVSTPLTEDDTINDTYGDLSSTLGGSRGDLQTASDVFNNVTPTQQFGELEVTSIVSPTKIIKTMISGIFNILVKVPQKILGVSPIVGGLIGAILFVLLIIGIWAIWKGAIS